MISTLNFKSLPSLKPICRLTALLVLTLFLTTYSVSTQAQTTAIVYSENFDAGTLPTGWTNAGIGANPAAVWMFGTNGNTPGGQIDGTGMAFFHDDDFDGDGGDVPQLTSDLIDLTAFDEVPNTISFDYIFEDLGLSFFLVEYSSDGGTTWNTILNENTDPGCFGFDSAGCAPRSVTNFPIPTADLTATFLLRFTYDDGNGWNWYASVDNIVIEAEVLPNDLCSTAESIGIGVTTGTTVNGTTDDTPFCGTSSTSPGVWYTYTPTVDGDVDMSLCGAPYDSKISVYTGTCDALVCEIGEDDDNTNCGGNDPFVTVPTTMGTTYFIHVHGFGGGSGTFDLNLAILCTELPAVVCQDFVVELDAAGTGSVTATDIDGGTTSGPDCGTLTLAIEAGDVTDFTCNDAAAIVTLVATNDFGTSSCDANVTIEDNIPATMVCQDATIVLDANGAGTLNVSDIDNGSSDNCSIIFSLSTTNFNCGNIGANSVTLTGTDTGGTATNCTANVTVQDTSGPTMICQNVTLFLDDAGTATLTAAQINNGSFDNCSPITLAISATDFTCADAGDNIVTLTGTDNLSLSNSCQATVTVADDSPAAIQCRQPISTVNTPGICGIENLTVLEPFVLSDNCGIGAGITITRIPSGDNFPIGTTTLFWTVTDSNGGTATCESLVIIEDAEVPVVGPCTTEIVYTNSDDCLAEVRIESAVTDNCGVTATGLGVFMMAPGLYEHPVVATDANGNVTTHIVSIEVHDDSTPEFVNCPTEPFTIAAGANGTAMFPFTPMASDNCGFPTVTNDMPEGGLPVGENTVTFTAADTYGNWVNCEVTVTVTSSIVALHPESVIEASLEENELSQIISWNALNASTGCQSCTETNLAGFQYIGTYWGHQYFLADELSMTHEEAKVAAEGYDAHLAVINDAAENAYLTEALNDNVRSAWIGLEPQFVDNAWTFAWENGDANNFDALQIEEVTEDTRVILTSDGTWENATTEEDKYFLIERPCVNIVQTGPIQQENEETVGVLLRSGDAWPQGEFDVTYTLTDMCGDVANISFPVEVTPAVADYCTTAGTDNSVWIEKVVFHDLVSETENNEGYADFTEEGMTMNIGDGVVLVNLQAGGNEAENMLYWRIFLDKNNDGDFFDANEMVYENASETNIEANVTLPVTSLDAARMRVMVSRYSFAAPCGDTYIGEIEDYNVTLLIPEDYARAACDVQVAGLTGQVNGGMVDLDWTVNSACPITDYRVEYSNNGSIFSSIENIVETENSSDIYTKSYNTNPLSTVGSAYYRIRVQPEGFPAFYTNTVSLSTIAQSEHTMLFPNPADSYVSIDLTNYRGEQVTVTVFDNLGKVQLVQKSDVVGGRTMTLGLNKLTSGIYNISISSNAKGIVTKRLVVNKLHGWNAKK